MRIIVAELSANYEGRGKTELPKSKRIIMMKDDGSVLIHNEKGFKPLNYMTKVDQFIVEEIEGETHLLFYGNKEKLEIIIHEKFEDYNLGLALDDPPLIREKTEDHLQHYVSLNLSKIDEMYEFINREYETGFGPVDILAKNVVTGALVAIEIKRSATMNAVYQVLRYTDSLRKFNTVFVEPVIAALDFNQSAIALAKQRDVKCITIPEDWAEKTIKPLTLFD